MIDLATLSRAGFHLRRYAAHRQQQYGKWTRAEQMLVDLAIELEGTEATVPAPQPWMFEVDPARVTPREKIAERYWVYRNRPNGDRVTLEFPSNVFRRTEAEAVWKALNESANEVSDG